MYRKIIVAVDGSENALRAAEEAVKIASYSLHSVITVVFVVEFSKSRHELLHAKGAEEVELTRRKKLFAVDQLMKTNRQDFQIEILHGEPGPTITAYANQEKSDLVVIGSRGLNRLQEMVLGSVSHQVLKSAECPVLIVK